jgi:hypothetical protein
MANRSGRNRARANRGQRSLEDEYQSLFNRQPRVRTAPLVIVTEHPVDLRQPSPLQIVESVATYGAYEEAV